jgi:hypothetical protein
MQVLAKKHGLQEHMLDVSQLFLVAEIAERKEEGIERTMFNSSYIICSQSRIWSRTGYSEGLYISYLLEASFMIYNHDTKTATVVAINC